MSHQCIESFDARAWAEDFVATFKANPDIASDPETMTAWFASALMRGYDEYANIPWVARVRRARNILEEAQHAKAVDMVIHRTVEPIG